MSKGKEISVKTLVSRGAGISFKSAEHSGNITWGSCDDDTMTFQILRHLTHMASLHSIGWLQTTWGLSQNHILYHQKFLLYRPICTRFYQTFSFLSQGAKALLECGADPLNVGKIGQSPLQVAHSSNAKDVLKVLQVSDDHFVQIQINWSKTNICFHNCTFSTGLGKRAKRSWNCENRGRRSRI